MWFNHVPFSPYHGSSNLGGGGWFNGGFVKLLVNLMGGGREEGWFNGGFVKLLVNLMGGEEGGGVV